MKRTLGILFLSMLSLTAFAEKKGTAVTTGGRTYNIGVVTGQNYQHEVLLNGSSYFFPGSAGNMAFGSATMVNFGAGYNFAIMPEFSVGGSFSVNHSGTTGFSFMAGPMYNLIYNGNVQDSFFLSGALGVVGTGTATGFSFRFDAGKRFEIFEHFTYRPSIGVLYVGNGGGTYFVMNLLGAALQF